MLYFDLHCHAYNTHILQTTTHSFHMNTYSFVGQNCLTIFKNVRLNWWWWWCLTVSCSWILSLYSTVCLYCIHYYYVYALKFLLHNFSFKLSVFFSRLTNGLPTKRLQYQLFHIIHFSIARARTHTLFRSFAILYY